MRNKIITALGAFMLTAGAMQAQTPTATPIDINTATRTQLADAGWGQYADAIIAARPYKSMNDLVEKKVVPPTAFEKGVNQFTIGNGDTPLSDPNKTSPTLTQPPVTPPTVTPGAPTSTPTTNPAVPPTVTPGSPTTAPNTNPAVPPTVTPGATPTTPSSATPSVAPGTTPAAPSGK